MTVKLDKTEARQGEKRFFQQRVLYISLAAAAVILFLAFFFMFLA
ncbi:hypothetical protein [Marinicauda algicola]|nr:hypothetical protein [Marinicauda algicola]